MVIYLIFFPHWKIKVFVKFCHTALLLIIQISLYLFKYTVINFQ